MMLRSLKSQRLFAQHHDAPTHHSAENHRGYDRAFNAAITAGSTFWTSPTTPRSLIEKIGASGSLLMAMMFDAPFIPTMCCVAPEIPHATYRSGFTVVPVCPT